MAGTNEVPLTSRVYRDINGVDIGAMVDANVTSATLCALPLPSNSTPTIRAAFDEGNGRVAELIGDAGNMCGFLSQGKTQMAWLLSLQPGQNDFNISGVSLGGEMEPMPAGATLTLSVVRLAEAGHDTLQKIEVKGIDGNTVIACGPPVVAQGSPQSEPAGSAATVTTKAAAVSVNGPFPENAAPSAPEEEKKIEMNIFPVWRDCIPGERMP